MLSLLAFSYYHDGGKQREYGCYVAGGRDEGSHYIVGVMTLSEQVKGHENRERYFDGVGDYAGDDREENYSERIYPEKEKTEQESDYAEQKGKDHYHHERRYQISSDYPGVVSVCLDNVQEHAGTEPARKRTAYVAPHFQESRKHYEHARYEQYLICVHSQDGPRHQIDNYA